VLAPTPVCEKILLVIRMNALKDPTSIPASIDSIDALDRDFLPWRDNGLGRVRVMKDLSKLDAKKRERLAAIISEFFSGSLAGTCSLQIADDFLVPTTDTSRGNWALKDPPEKLLETIKDLITAMPDIGTDDLLEELREQHRHNSISRTHLVHLISQTYFKYPGLTTLRKNAQEKARKIKAQNPDEEEEADGAPQEADKGEATVDKQELTGLKDMAIAILERHSKITKVGLWRELRAAFPGREISRNALYWTIRVVRKTEAALATRLVDGKLPKRRGETRAEAERNEENETKEAAVETDRPPAAVADANKGAAASEEKDVTLGDLIEKSKEILRTHVGTVTTAELIAELDKHFEGVTISKNSMKIIALNIRRAGGMLAQKLVEKRASSERATRTYAQREPEAEKPKGSIPDEIFEAAHVLIKVNHGITAEDLHAKFSEEYPQHTLSLSDVTERIIPRVCRNDPTLGEERVRSIRAQRRMEKTTIPPVVEPEPLASRMEIRTEPPRRAAPEPAVNRIREAARDEIAESPREEPRVRTPRAAIVPEMRGRDIRDEVIAEDTAADTSEEQPQPVQRKATKSARSMGSKSKMDVYVQQIRDLLSTNLLLTNQELADKLGLSVKTVGGNVLAAFYARYPTMRTKRVEARRKAGNEQTLKTAKSRKRRPSLVEVAGKKGAIIETAYDILQAEPGMTANDLYAELVKKLPGKKPSKKYITNNLITCIFRNHPGFKRIRQKAVLNRRESETSAGVPVKPQPVRRAAKPEKAGENIIETAYNILKADPGMSYADLYARLLESLPGEKPSRKYIEHTIMYRLFKKYPELKRARENSGVMRASRDEVAKTAYRLLKEKLDMSNEELTVLLVNKFPGNKMTPENVKGPVLGAVYKKHPKLKELRRKARIKEAYLRTAKVPQKEIQKAAYQIMNSNLSLTNQELVLSLKAKFPKNPITKHYLNSAIIPTVYRSYPELKELRKKARMEKPEPVPAKASINEIVKATYALMKRSPELTNLELAEQLKPKFPGNPISESYLSGCIIAKVYKAHPRIRIIRKRARKSEAAEIKIEKPNVAGPIRQTAVSEIDGVAARIAARRLSRKATMKDVVSAVDDLTTVLLEGIRTSIGKK
ncbi:MAG: hypothetical protein V1492_06445, partial [Candidatus Micrarchaeota archaeon]